MNNQQSILLPRVGRLPIYSSLVLAIAAAVMAQPLQREWIRNYSLDASKLNQATAIAAAPDGNIVVAGTSANASGDLDYQIIKYKPNGEEAWKIRHGSANAGNDELRAMIIDPLGNIIVTGTSETVKLNSAGSVVWSVPRGGRALAATGNYVYITGYSETDFATAQLENNDTDGHEIWSRTVDGRARGIDISQAIALDPDGNIYVAGQEEYDPCVGLSCRRIFAVVSYTPQGIQRWFSEGDPRPGPVHLVDVSSIVFRRDATLGVYGSYNPDSLYKAGFCEFDASGVNVWNKSDFAYVGSKMILDKSGKLLMTGMDYDLHAFLSVIDDANTTVRTVWTYNGSPDGTRALYLQQDSQGNVYITGYTYNTPSSKTLFLAKVTSGGQQLGLDRFQSPNAGNNYGTALTIDSHDNVYVTGYVLNTQGGSEFVTIKYSAPPQIVPKPSGAMHLEFRASPGQPYAIEGTSDFFNWQSLITNAADANGLIQFDDTNAPSIPYRFYRGKQP